MRCSSCYPCHCSFLPIIVSSFQNSTTDRKLVSSVFAPFQWHAESVIHRRCLHRRGQGRSGRGLQLLCLSRRRYRGLFPGALSLHAFVQCVLTLRPCSLMPVSGSTVHLIVWQWCTWWNRRLWLRHSVCVRRA